MIDPTVQQIFIIGFAAYEQARRLPDHIRYAGWCILSCRTSILGGHKQSCPDGHFHRIWYNSCKHRMCPICAFTQIVRWLEKQKAGLLACDHFHVIFTLPEQLRFLWQFNPRLMTNLLFRCSRDTLFELLSDMKYLGAKPGMIASFHSWDKKMNVHPHTHCLVTGGGLSLSGEWISVKNGFLLPFAVVRDKFRGKLIAYIKKSLLSGELVLPDGMNKQRLLNLLNKLGGKKWNVKICEKYSHGNGVLVYPAHYLRGGPIGNSRIENIENGNVTFNCGRGKKELMTLKIEEFIERYLRHVPLPNMILVRSYGVYANSNREELIKCRQILGQGDIEDIATIPWQDCIEADDDNHPGKCPVCGKDLVITEKYLAQWSPRYSTKPPRFKYPLREAA